VIYIAPKSQKRIMAQVT